MRNSAIAASGLRKAYKDKLVLDGIDLDVETGTIFSLLGPNGAPSSVRTSKDPSIPICTSRFSHHREVRRARRDGAGYHGRPLPA
jgi:hypothetical protein